MNIAEGYMPTQPAGAAALSGQQSWVRELADPESAFYQDMLSQLQKRAQEKKEEDRENAVIDALGQVIDAMNAKDDDPKRPGMGRSFVELSEAISQLDPDDPERARLEQMVKRLSDLGIWFSLPGLDQKDSGDTETLTQLLTRMRVKELQAED